MFLSTLLDEEFYRQSPVFGRQVIYRLMSNIAYEQQGIQSTELGGPTGI